MQTHYQTPETKMPDRIGIDLQQHIDTIHLAAVETLRGSRDPQVVSAGQRALETVIARAGESPETRSIVEVARITEQAFDAVLGSPNDDRSRVGHYVAAIVADLSRTVDAADRGNDPGAFIEHARSLYNSIPKSDQETLIEIDLNDRDQLARLLQSHDSAVPDDTGYATTKPDVSLLRDRFSDFVHHADRLLETAEDPGTLDALVDSLVELQTTAAESQIEHIGRVVACALRVVESHRSAGEALPLDAVEFVIACRRIIPMILESLDDPDRVSHAVDALVDQSAFVLLELRRGTRPLGNLWPEPETSEYQAIANGTSTLEPPETDDAAPVEYEQPEGADGAGDWLSSEVRPEAGMLAGPGPGTEALEETGPTLRVPVDQIEQLMHLAGELAIRSGGYNQRSRKVLSVSQDINSVGDRLRYLVRAWNDGQYREDQIQHHLSEITADLGLAAADLEHARSDHIAASERQADVRTRLEATISELRSMPLKALTDPLRTIVADVARNLDRDVELRVEGASTVVDALHADALADALKHLVINAVEHGIEPAEVRQNTGKSPQGLIRIKATRDGSQSVIQVMDDGAGMDDSVIMEHAVAAGYPVPKRGMTRDRILQYIFLPGFTTKDRRDGEDFGMGLDCVSDAVSSASGSITVHSETGYGTVFTLRLPVAAMAMPATIVAISSERYAIPAAEVEVLDPAQMGSIESKVDGYRAQVDDDTLPAADLGALLSVRSHHHVQNEHGTFLKVRCDGEAWVLRVDRVQERESIAIQPLGREYHPVSGVVGVATLASGEQAQVLDIAQVLDNSSRRARRLSRQTASLTRVPFALVSDDSISVRRELAVHLEQDGWRVVEARDAFEARELLETVVPDLIVVDLDLPAHGGFQISQAARNLNDMPVIGLTSRDDPEIRTRAESFNIDACLAKPLDLDSFGDLVDRVLRGQEAGD